MAKTQIDIERLLQWTYRDELPKQRFALDGSSLSSSYEGVLAYGAMGGIDIDETPRLPAALGAPHPDALVIEQHVRGLAAVKIEWEANAAALMGEFAGIVVAPARLRYWSADLEPLVVMHARMGTRPDWRHDPFICERVQGGNGKAVVDGRDPETHRYLRVADAEGRFARCPLQWTPDPALVAESRMEYAAWHGALCDLAESLAGPWLRNHEPAPPACSPEPWLTPDPQARILPSLGGGSPQRMGVSPRPRMLAPLPHSAHGPVRRLTAPGN